MQAGESMSIFLGRLMQTVRDLKNAEKDIPQDEIAYQMLARLPDEFDGTVRQLYQYKDSEFTRERENSLIIGIRTD